MNRILITGATGNVGLEVIKALLEAPTPFQIQAGVRTLDQGNDKLKGYDLQLVLFDFTDVATYQPALAQCDVLFLLRPPQISDVEKYFRPLIETAQAVGLPHIVFLSVQGVEKSSIIPHHKIEKLIVASLIPYTFLRPAYFMQNFSTTLRDDLVNKNRVFLPAGQASFTLIDVADIGQVAAKILTNTADYANQAFDLTCNERLNFGEMAEKLSQGLGRPIRYESPNLLHFYLTKRKEKVPPMLILVMIMLHYLPRFQTVPPMTQSVQQITGKAARSFEQFIAANKTLLRK